MIVISRDHTWRIVIKTADLNIRILFHQNVAILIECLFVTARVAKINRKKCLKTLIVVQTNRLLNQTYQ